MSIVVYNDSRHKPVQELTWEKIRGYHFASACRIITSKRSGKPRSYGTGLCHATALKAGKSSYLRLKLFSFRAIFFENRCLRRLMRPPAIVTVRGICSEYSILPATE